MEKSAVKKEEVLGIVRIRCAESLGVDLLKFSHGGATIEEREKMDMVVVIGYGGRRRMERWVHVCGGAYQHFRKSRGCSHFTFTLICISKYFLPPIEF